MALVHCRGCTSEISNSAATCPRCGVCAPAGTGTLTFVRPSLFSVAIGVEVFVDGRPYGKLRPMGRVSVPVTPGEHHIGLTSTRGNPTVATVSTHQGDTAVKVGFTFLGSPQLS